MLSGTRSRSRRCYYTQRFGLQRFARSEAHASGRSEDLGDPCATGDFGLTVLLRRGMAGRKDGCTYGSEGGDVDGNIVLDLKVGENCVAVRADPCAIRQGLLDIALDTLRVPCQCNPVVTGAHSLVIDVSKGPMKAGADQWQVCINREFGGSITLEPLI